MRTEGLGRGEESREGKEGKRRRRWEGMWMFGMERKNIRGEDELKII